MESKHGAGLERLSALRRHVWDVTESTECNRLNEHPQAGDFTEITWRADWPLLVLSDGVHDRGDRERAIECHCFDRAGSAERVHWFRQAVKIQEQRANGKPRRARGIGQLLLLLGCHRSYCYAPKHYNHPKRRLPGSSFWSRNSGRLEETLIDVHRQFRRQMKRVHPDKTGRHAEAAAVTAAWGDIKRRFKARGIEL